jgi:hypothetical protein
MYIHIYMKPTKKASFFCIEKRNLKDNHPWIYIYTRERKKKMLMLNDKQIIQLTNSTGTVLFLLLLVDMFNQTGNTPHSKC